MNPTVLVAFCCLLQRLIISTLGFGLAAHRSLLLYTISAKNCSDASRHLFLLLPNFLLVSSTKKEQRATAFFPVTISVSFCTTRFLFPEKRANKITLAQDPIQMEKYFSVLPHQQGNFHLLYIQLCPVFRRIIYSIII